MSTIQEKRFDGQVAVVTGAGGGMGREHAKLLGSRGASVVVNDLSQGAEETVKMIVDAGGKAVVNHDDVSTEAGGAAIVNTAIEKFGRIDILISNAGIISNVPFAKLTEAQFDKVMKVNAYGAFHVTKAAWPHFIKQNYGRIVLVTSSTAFVGQPNISQYAASKGAVLGMGKSISEEAPAYGITVNMLAPGAFTAMAGAMEDEEARKRIETMMPASLVSPIVAWLAHKDNTLNGEVIEAVSGRAALNFFGSTKGYWNKELTIEDLDANKDKIMDKEGFGTLVNTPAMTSWWTENTGWAAEFNK
ncbi:SDR family NAD(P)-dependent oxidoreductase [Cohnella sp. AR92]|uniref:SDR family NAD(P)-dependent oxidoreductase n=1 Tax=Cohnella sp. AR92 TaxID=648716 RepID=UPI000F8E8DC7|nr:SDR family NAD(P)-dependent oxidoreductase [Cohnella sp. AR92]RUS46897.1 SDR family NAD(P)-dependent oxidoreductase [Cohnella sp. AR92]